MHDNQLFKREFRKIISDLALTIPHIGLTSGGLTILIHILKERAAMAKEEPVKMKEPSGAGCIKLLITFLITVS